jgi:two-component system chemotaxis response regulator CheB
VQEAVLSNQVILIGASTGGTTAVERVLSGLSRTGPGVVVALHLPGRVSAQFARRLNDSLPLHVKEAEDGDRLLCGTVLLGSSRCHLVLRKYSTGFRVRLIAGAATDRVRPSINRLFNSAADCAGEEAMGIILTGMGDDGASGLLKMRQAGALTVAEDESSAVVFGMPKAAQALGAAARVLPLQQIHSAIVDFAGRRAWARDR